MKSRSLSLKACIDEVAMLQGWSRWEPGDVNPEAKNKPRDICPVKTGYGISFGGIKIFEGVSTYSVMDKIAQALPNTIDATKARQQMLQVCNPFFFCMGCFFSWG